MQKRQIQEMKDQIRQRDEDVKAMLEIQCIVIEDLLIKSRFNNQAREQQTKSPMLSGDITPINQRTIS